MVLLPVAAVSDATLVGFSDGNVGLLLVQADAEAFQLTGDDVLVGERLGGVDHDEDQVARAGCADDLATTALAIFGTLNDSRQIHNLNFGSAVHQGAWNSRQSLSSRTKHMRAGRQAASITV